MSRKRRKGFNYKSYLRRINSKRHQKLQRKQEAHNKMWLARKKERQAIEARIAKLQLPNVAKELIEKYNLPATQRGKRILRHALRRGFLRNYEIKGANQGAKLKVKEKISLKLADNSAKIHIGLWKHKHGMIPLREVHGMHNAAIEILKTAMKEIPMDKKTRANMELELKNLKETEANLNNLVKMEAVGSVKPKNLNSLAGIGDVGEILVDRLYDKLPEFSQIGFQIIDKVVMEAFGEGQ